jgi:thymidine kinase
MSLDLTIGPMFSGKSTIHIDLLSTHSPSFKVLYINSLLDVRSPGTLSSRDGITESLFPKATFMKVGLLEECGDLPEFDYILVDEGQFFPDLLKVVEWADKGKFVTVVGLNGDSNAQNFGQLYKLIPHADRVDVKKGVCHKCKSKSLYTMKIEENDKLVEIGDSNYVALCRRCANCLREDRTSNLDASGNIPNH